MEITKKQTNNTTSHVPQLQKMEWTGHFNSLIGRERRANIRVVYVMKVFANAKNKALDCRGQFQLVWQTQICNL